jgi:PmbA protein
MSELLELSERIVNYSKKLGAQEVSVAVSGGTHTTILRRNGQIEQATEATTRGCGVSLLVDDRYSSHSTSDLREGALEAFLDRAVAATRFLEPEPERRQPELALCGRGCTPEQLDQDDPAWYLRTAKDRAALAEEMEVALRERHPENIISSAVYASEGNAESILVMSNGFSDEDRGGWYALGGEMTLDDGNGKRPESSAYYAARYLGDIPSASEIAAEVLSRTLERMNSSPIDSGSYPMILLNRSAGRLLGAFQGPLGGGGIFEQRSCMIDRLGTRVGSDLFTIYDDPTIPRGLGSRPWDGDALIARPRTVVEKGILKEYNIGVYYGRKLNVAPTSASMSNWVVPPGARTMQEMAADLPKAIVVSGFLGGNSNATTGDFSFGIRGVLLEYGEPVQSLSEMNVGGNVTDLFERLVEVGNDPWEYSSVRSPSLLLEGVRFSGT